MERIKNTFKSTKASNFFQSLFLASIALYLMMFADGGMFTTYYAAMLSVVIGIISALFASVQKRFGLTVTTLLTTAALLIQFVTI